MKKLLVVSGPNLNLLGSREPDVYGRTTLPEIEAMVKERVAAAGHEALCFQSNSEGAILDFLQREAPAASGIVLNPGALTHYSYALFDACAQLTASLSGGVLPPISLWGGGLLMAPLDFG